MKYQTPILLPLIAALAVSGCVSPALQGESRDFIEKTTATADALKENVVTRAQGNRAERERREFVNRPYLVGKSVALAPEAKLPLALRANVKTALMFPKKRVSLPEFAQQVTLATRIPVVIAPDVYLPPDALLPRSQKEGSNQGAAPALAAPAVAQQAAAGRAANGPLPPLGSVVGTGASGGLVSAGYGGSVDTPQDVDVQREEMELNQTLDLTATRLGINWTWDQKKGVIRFYRMVTKTWLLPIKPANMSYTSAFQNGTVQTNNQNALNSVNEQSPTRSEAQNINEINSILNDVQTVMTRAGTVSGNVASGTITITDTKDVVDRAEEIVDFHRGQLSKMVVLHLRLIQIKRNNNGQLAVDWQAALSKALNNVPGFVLTSTSPTTLASTISGSLGMQITSGDAKGTQMVVQALKDMGDVASTDDIPLQIQNRHSLYYNNRLRYSYVSATTPATATAGGTGGVPGITTAQDQVGLKLMLYPTVTDNNSIALTVSLDNSILQRLDSFSSGQGANQQTVQLPNVTGQGATTDALIRNGGMVVLTAFDHNDTEFDKRTLGDNIPMLLGGSKNVSRSRTATLIVISASIRDIGSGRGVGS
ncbi:hypothetical protein ACPCHQ_22020 [Ralstonia thomasii]|uniref:hypothetical protein n=1 Tax=Ralstonia thomasii TaxID=3058596 RepID=UPI003C308A41